MPETDVWLYREEDGAVPVRDWLANLMKTNRKAFAKCAERVERLSALGDELRRPHADFLRDGIHELRGRHRNVNYRILYFLYGRDGAVLVHALTKEGRVPVAEIERAIARKRAFECNPRRHTHEEG